MRNTILHSRKKLGTTDYSSSNLHSVLQLALLPPSGHTQQTQPSMLRPHVGHRGCSVFIEISLFAVSGLLPSIQQWNSPDLQRPPVAVTLHDDDLIQYRSEVRVTGAIICSAGNSCVVPTPGCAAGLVLHPARARTYMHNTPKSP